MHNTPPIVGIRFIFNSGTWRLEAKYEIWLVRLNFKLVGSYKCSITTDNYGECYNGDVSSHVTIVGEIYIPQR